MTSTISTRPTRFDDIEILCALGTVCCPISVLLVVVAAAIVVVVVAAAAVVVVVVP